MKRLLACLVCALLLTPQAHAFDLDQLAAQLAKPAVVRGPFVQEKHLRALPKPLTSTGQFVLSKDLGLLWLLQSPLQQAYRIDANGIAKRTPQGWQAVPQQNASAQQNRLFLAVLKGDTSGLRQDFDLSLAGAADAWTLDLVPRSLLLKQIFTTIQITGGAQVARIELRETQGDSTVLRLTDSHADSQLSDTDRHAFAD